MYTGTLGATPLCVTRAQQEEAANLCGCLRSGGTVSIGSLGAGDAYSAIDFTSSTRGPCKPSIPMPADFDPLDPCEAAARPICPPRLARPTTTTPSATTPITYSPSDYEEEVTSDVVRNQRIMVFGILGLVVAGGAVMLYRVVKKG